MRCSLHKALPLLGLAAQLVAAAPANTTSTSPQDLVAELRKRAEIEPRVDYYNGVMKFYDEYNFNELLHTEDLFYSHWLGEDHCFDLPSNIHNKAKAIWIEPISRWGYVKCSLYRDVNCGRGNYFVDMSDVHAWADVRGNGDTSLKGEHYNLPSHLERAVKSYKCRVYDSSGPFASIKWYDHEDFSGYLGTNLVPHGANNECYNRLNLKLSVQQRASAIWIENLDSFPIECKFWDHYRCEDSGNARQAVTVPARGAKHHNFKAGVRNDINSFKCIRSVHGQNIEETAHIGNSKYRFPA